MSPYHCPILCLAHEFCHLTKIKVYCEPIALEKILDRASLRTNVFSSPIGEVAEWLKAHAWKVCIRQRIEGSNPSLSAMKNRVVEILPFHCHFFDIYL